MNTADYLLEAGGDSYPALIVNKTTYTYREVRDASARVAAELIAAGVQPTDRVGIFGNNSLFWLASYLATLKLGAVAVPFATALTAEAICEMQAFVGCSVICAEQRVYRRFAGAFAESHPVIFDQVLNSVGAKAWPVGETTDPTADAALMFTSGTTARPRAVRITHRNIQANTNSIVNYLALDANERIGVILPFYYCFGTSLLHTHLRVGGTLVVSNQFVYPETTLDLMEATECTGFAGVPSTYQTLLRNSTFPRRELKSLRKVQQAGGKLQTVLIQELIGAVKQGEVYVMYGQTEATARLSYLPPQLLGSRVRLDRARHSAGHLACDQRGRPACQVRRGR